MIAVSDLYWKLVPTVGGIMAKVTHLVLSEYFSNLSLQNRSKGQGWIHMGCMNLGIKGWKTGICKVGGVRSGSNLALWILCPWCF